MPQYNRKFDLSVEDLELIETALRKKKRSLSDKRLVATGEETEVDETLRDIHELLGRLHNQKTFYRPKSDIYVGG